jgi:3-hydroxyisobutyrate dehydrogenase-like beta-hydroxyacid dehydrogenase
MSERVGIVGLGLMGSAFTHHLLQGGFAVQGYDIDEARGRQLHERGGSPVESPAATALGARWVLTSLPNSDIVREVVLGPSGIAEGAGPGLIIADASTSRPEDSQKLAAELAKRGLRGLDEYASFLAAPGAPATIRDVVPSC